MSQGIFSNIDPTATTGLMLAGLLDDFKEAIVSGFSGSARPANLQAGGMWVDNSLQESPNFLWVVKLYTGTSDIEIFRVSVISGVSGSSFASGLFTVKRISADTAAAILNMVKNRIANAGKVLSTDTIAEIRFRGRSDTSTDPIVGYIRVTAAEDMLSTSQGVVLSLVSSPVSTGQLIEHMKFIASTVEAVAPHKINSLIYGSDSIATASSLLLTSDKILSELTGSTVSTVHGIEVGTAETRVKHIHNRSTAEITFKHASATASASERFSLPESKDIIIVPQGSASFFYCETDLRWKYLYGRIAEVRPFVESFPDGYTEWVAPLTGNIRVISFQEQTQEATSLNANSAFSRAAIRGLLSWGDNAHGQLGVGDAIPRSVPVSVLGGLRFRDAEISSESSGALTDNDEAYAWGRNQHGQLGLGDVTPRSSPVAVLGGLAFTRLDVGESSFAQKYSGVLFAWGRNQHGQLGLGDVVPRSSPVAVLLGLRFSSAFHGAEGEASVYGVERDTGLLFSWGQNTNGQLGVGDVASRSSPVAVLGGLKFRKVAVGLDCAVGLTESGLAFGWGVNTNGELGVGNVVPRSSPVAVLGGLTFTDVFSLSGTGNSFFGMTSDGDLYAWGANANGQLGVGNVTPRSSPVAVLGGLKWERLSRLNAGSRSVIAIQKGTGSAFAWGANAAGQLGVGDVAPRSSPVAVLGGLLFSSITLGEDFAYGEASGRHYAWGENPKGEVGDNTVVDKSSPTLVAGLTEAFFEVPTVKVIAVVKGTTYKLKLGGGVSFFGSTTLGKNIRRATIAYEIN